MLSARSAFFSLHSNEKVVFTKTYCNNLSLFILSLINKHLSELVKFLILLSIFYIGAETREYFSVFIRSEIHLNRAMKRKRNNIRKEDNDTAPIEMSSKTAKRVTRSSSGVSLQSIQGSVSVDCDGPLPKIARRRQAATSKISKNERQQTEISEQADRTASLNEFPETLTRTLSLPILSMQDFESPLQTEAVRSTKFNYLESALLAARTEAAAAKMKSTASVHQPRIISSEKLIPSNWSAKFLHPYLSTARGYGRVNNVLTSRKPLSFLVTESTTRASDMRNDFQPLIPITSDRERTPTPVPAMQSEAGARCPTLPSTMTTAVVQTPMRTFEYPSVTAALERQNTCLPTSTAASTARDFAYLTQPSNKTAKTLDATHPPDLKSATARHFSYPASSVTRRDFTHPYTATSARGFTRSLESTSPAAANCYVVCPPSTRGPTTAQTATSATEVQQCYASENNNCDQNNVFASNRNSNDISILESHVVSNNDHLRKNLNNAQYDNMCNDLNNDLHSTNYIHESNVSDQRTQSDITLSIINALNSTLAAIKETTLNSQNSKIINRISNRKSLPAFSGDALDWTRYKQAYDISTETDAYSDHENVIRIFESLRGEAREMTKALFAGGNTAHEIMSSLEARFGNPRVILHKIINEIRELPNLNSRKMTIIEFAPRVKNVVKAIKSLNYVGHLYNSDLVNHILLKLPRSMYEQYIRFAALQEKNKPDLEKVADFLHSEAQMTLDAGIFPSLDCLNKSDKTENRTNRKVYERPVFLIDSNDSSIENSVKKNRDFNKQCLYCGVKNHNISACHDFGRAPIAMRWKTVRKFKLCYKCFSVGHSALNCNFENCKICSRKHNILLHYNENLNYNKKVETVDRSKHENEFRHEKPSKSL